MIAGKALLWGFIKSSNYSHHARHARPQQFAMVEGFLNIQSLLWLKVKAVQGYLLGCICTRTISEVWCGMCALEETAGKPKKQIAVWLRHSEETQTMPLLRIMDNRDNIPGKYPNQPRGTVANLLLCK